MHPNPTTRDLHFSIRINRSTTTNQYPLPSAVAPILTTGPGNDLPPPDPKNPAAPKSNTGPSEAKNLYPCPLPSAPIPTKGFAKYVPPIEPKNGALGYVPKVVQLLAVEQRSDPRWSSYFEMTITDSHLRPNKRCCDTSLHPPKRISQLRSIDLRRLRDEALLLTPTTTIELN